MKILGEFILELNQIRKSFGKTEVLKGISLEVKKGEFITFLGSSGCGKTTTLRIIAGLEQPDGGSVMLEGQDVTRVAPDKRDVNTVFQSYALFPHMNVFQNVAYGLKIRKVPKEEIQKRVMESLELVQLSEYAKRKPSELSGGQRQRVAIARAVINNPKVLLLDEPLGALDLQLRRQMQLELKRLQKKLGITFIYITHDQEEAINMSDRIVIMKDGQFIQVGTPDEVYNHPKTSFVAQFVGNANIVNGVVEALGDGVAAVRIYTPSRKEKSEGNPEDYAVNHTGVAYVPFEEGDSLQIGDTIAIAVRSENILLGASKKNGLRAVVKEKSFAGGLLRLTLVLPNGKELVASRHGINYEIEEGESITIGWDTNMAVIVED